VPGSIGSRSRSTVRVWNELSGWICLRDAPERPRPRAGPWWPPAARGGGQRSCG
jgi:hypothetical protein